MRSLLILLLLTSSFSFGRNKAIQLKNINSSVSEYSSTQFKNAIRQTLEEIGYTIDSTNTKYTLTAKINRSSGGGNRYDIFFKLVDSKKNRFVETYDKANTLYKHQSFKDMIKKALMSMNTFKAELEWDNSMMPGVSYQFYAPRNNDLGVYRGPNVDFVFYSRSKKTASTYRGPSRMKYYGTIGILNAENNDLNDLLFVSAGTNLSFESNTNRNFLLPYFGIELGGLYSKDISTFQFTPVIGCQLISTKRFIWSAQGGYLYSIKKFDDYSGYTIGTSLNILLWE